MLRRFKKHLINLPGWHTRRRIVVLESDDWGSVRTSSKQALKALAEAGVAVDACHYTQHDCLAGSDDLEAIFSVLGKHKFKDNQPAKITANCLVANPCFEKIRESEFQEYFAEDFRQTLARNPAHAHSFQIWQEGMDAGLMKPQSHGREHLNLSRWMKALRSGDKITKLAFDHNMFGISSHIIPQARGSFLAAFDGAPGEIIYDHKEIVQEALLSFQRIFGFKSKSFIAPNYVWGREIEYALHNEGVSYIQSSTAQRLPAAGHEKNKLVRHYTGQKNALQQRYLVRNCMFEPASNLMKDWVDSCLKEIAIAFQWKKPAIISTHRVNYIGQLDVRNRDRGLVQLDALLRQIGKLWPDVEFMSSDELGDEITKK